MSQVGLEQVLAEVKAIETVRHVGRISHIGRGYISVGGLSDTAAQSDLVAITCSSGRVRFGEVLNLDQSSVTVLPDGDLEGLKIGDEVILAGGGTIAPDDSWIGRVVDPMGQALDHKPILRGEKTHALRGSPQNPTDRRPLGARLETGLAVFNTFLPIVRGQRIGLFAGSGVGKSTLLAKLARNVEADLVVIALVGERGREVREFVERVLGPEGMSRAIVVAATSDRSAMVRRRCGWAAMTIAEHFRDQGRHVLFLADSVTRFAEAHREIALASGEGASMRGYPPSTAQQITALCERAGPGSDDAGDITAVFSVLVAGSDMEEPVADILRGVLDGHVVLDRDIAQRGRFPAIDLLRSVSRALPFAATDEENELISSGRQLLGHYQKSEMMIQAGLYSAGSDPLLDHAVQIWPDLDAFLSKSETGNASQSFATLAACLAGDSGADKGAEEVASDVLEKG